MLNNPLRYTDPSGHLSNDEIMELFGTEEWENVLAEFRNGGRLEGRWGFLLMLSKLMGPSGSGVTEMARIYESSTTRPWGRFDYGYPNAGDTLAMTLRAAEVNGQLALLKHLDGGSYSQVSVFDAGMVGTVWTSYHQGHEERVGSSPVRGHGFLTGSSSHMMTFDPNNFDAVGAVLDGGGLIAEALGLKAVGVGISAIEVGRAWSTFATTGVQVVWGQAPLSELGGPSWDLVVEVGGAIGGPAVDIYDLYTNFHDGSYIDKTR